MENKVYCFDLGMSSEEVLELANGFSIHTNDMEVYKKNGSVYAEFFAGSEKEIDEKIEEVCGLIAHSYPKLALQGAAFEVQL